MILLKGGKTEKHAREGWPSARQPPDGQTREETISRIPNSGAEPLKEDTRWPPASFQGYYLMTRVSVAATSLTLCFT